ncbi:MarR family transcriptional regulator [Streptomyces sp. A7024]|uniref:MarR family transcriptional regulator n=1 Tax=Streptomyces coryli TaxID=1128680 RepID=A0A6G4UCG4_9ACTN|nr:MarR family transcriptional regulator [Streptomyces coryli]NGN69702.1 MarR family transcriptional regulator [Streptomyces coryli]
MATRTQYEDLARQIGVIGPVRRELGRALPPHCSTSSSVVLSLLRHHGELRLGRIAELLDVDVSVASRHLAYCVDRGWIERRCDPADKRSKLLRLSEAGERLLDDISDRYTEALAASLADWPDDDVVRLTELMTRLRASFGLPPTVARGAHATSTTNANAQ